MWQSRLPAKSPRRGWSLYSGGKAFNQQFHHGFELYHVLAALVRAFDILFELAGAAERPHTPRSAKSSFLLSNRLTLFPDLLAFSVRAVRALGIRTSKGKPRCSLICR